MNIEDLITMAEEHWKVFTLALSNGDGLDARLALGRYRAVINEIERSLDTIS